MKKRRVFLPLLICIAAAFFACGIFAIFNTKDRGQTVTAEAATAYTPTIYWKYDSSNTTLTLSNSQLTGGTETGSFASDTVFTTAATQPWTAYGQDVTTVNIATPISPVSTQAWFRVFRKLQKVENIGNLDTSNAVTLQSMFAGCHTLPEIDVSGFDTSNATSIAQMFSSCYALSEVDVSGFNTSKVEYLGSMFSGCSALTKIDVSKFDTSKVKDMNYMFEGCTSLETLDLSNFDVSSLNPFDTYSISCIFQDMSALKKLKLSDSLAGVISSVTNNSDYGVNITLPFYYQDGTVCNTVAKMNKGGGYFKSIHYHTYDTTPTSIDEASCSDTGTEYYDCQESFCTYVKTETIPANGQHDYVAGEVTPPTCTEQGYTTYSCSACGHTKRDDYTAVLPHAYEGVTTDPTCTATGFTTYTCPDCGKTYVGDEVPAKGHDFNAWHQTKAPTEDEEGEEQRECQRAGCSEVETRPIDALEHTHKFAEGWTSDETNHWHASTCGHNVKDGEAAHTWNDGEITTPATCTAEGVKTFTCTVCAKTKTEAVDKIAHTEELDEAVDPDCINTGLTEGKHCSVCNYVIVAQQTKPALGHNYEAVEGGTPPTCTTAGSGKVVCTRCGDEKVGDSIPALGHNAGTAATCTEPQTCTVCGTELAPALGHTEVTDEAKAPTCTETGLTAGTHCSVCGEVLTAQEEVPALGHTYEWVITKEATTEEIGLMENKCTVCGNKDGEQEIAKLVDPNGEIDLPVDINVEFKVTQSSTDNDYSNIEKGLKRGYWAQLWYRNDDGTLGDEFTDKINCFLTLKIPTDIIEAIRGGEEINRDKIAAGLKVYYIDGDGAPVEVDNFTIAMRDDDSWQIKFNYNEKFRAEVVFAADLADQPTPEPEQAGIPWWVWLIVGLVVVAIVGVVIVIIVVAKKKGDGGNGGDTEELKAQLAEQGEKIDELLGRDDGGFNTPVELDENGNVIFK